MHYDNVVPKRLTGAVLALLNIVILSAVPPQESLALAFPPMKITSDQ